MQFWNKCTSAVAPKIIDALGLASGSLDVASDAHFNFRMVDYYSRPATDITAPRCGEHRDFGSFSLIFASDPGLQAFIDGEWNDISPPAGAAILLFGWCTQIRSNGRIPAALHRVADHLSVDGIVPRRTSAVLFVAPKDVNTPLEPVVREGELRQYISGVKVGQLRGKLARKWRWREGTLNESDKQLEEEEIRVTHMASQDDVVHRSVVAA